jgi:hypothetical protein
MPHVELVFIICYNIDLKVVVDLSPAFNLLIVGQFVIEAVNIFIDQSNNPIGLLGKGGNMEGQDFFGYV